MNNVDTSGKTHSAGQTPLEPCLLSSHSVGEGASPSLCRGVSSHPDRRCHSAAGRRYGAGPHLQDREPRSSFSRSRKTSHLHVAEHECQAGKVGGARGVRLFTFNLRYTRRQLLDLGLTEYVNRCKVALTEEKRGPAPVNVKNTREPETLPNGVG